MNHIPSLALFIWISSLGVALIIVGLVRYWKAKRGQSRKITSPPGQEGKSKSYTYKDFAQDVGDENVDIAEILERCKDALPPEPGGATESSIQKEGSQQNVSSRQAWFAQLAQQLPKLTIVPPPVPKAVIVVPGFTTPCPCVRGGANMPTQLPRLGSFIQDKRNLETHGKPVCEKCNGTGVIIITGGK